jgi:hypothetical protein
MGYDASCILRLDRRTIKGTAWLEHKDLVFRGPERLVIPLAAVKTATAEGDVLRVRFGAREAEFQIGRAAVKWADRITNPPSRLEKLGVKPGLSVALLGVDDDTFLRDLEKLGAMVTRPGPSEVPRLRGLDAIFLGAAHSAALGRLAALRASIQPAGAIWVVRPKGLKSITEAETMAAGKRGGLVDVKVVSFSETHTAEKFVIPRALRSRPPRALRSRPPVAARPRGQR